MFERVRRFKRDRRDHPDQEHGGVATAERPESRQAATRERARDDAHPARRDVADRETAVRDARARQHDEFGGFNLGAAFFGWLVAVGMAALLIAVLAAAGAAIGLTEDPSASAADEIGIAGGILLVCVLALAYFCGGYVAGRMSRFDGGRQGLGVWLLGLLTTLVIAAAGAIFGSEYNVLERLDLPRIPIDEGDLTTGGIIALALIVLGTLVAAMFGGKAGERYHRRVDRVGVVDRY